MDDTPPAPSGQTYEVHPAATLFPMMTDAEIDDLAQDIKQNGQQTPVVYWRGKLIDGRNRMEACRRIGRQVMECEIDDTDDPVKYVLGANLHRRHLSESQRAMVGARLKEIFAAEAKERQKRKPASFVPQNFSEQKGDSRDKAAEAVNVSGPLIDAAAKVSKQGVPELAAAVVAGDIAVTRAAKIATLEPEQQREAIAKPKKGKPKPKPAPRKKSKPLPPPPPPPPEEDDDGDEDARRDEANHRLLAAIQKTPEKMDLLRILFDAMTTEQRQWAAELWADWSQEGGDA